MTFSSLLITWLIECLQGEARIFVKLLVGPEAPRGGALDADAYTGSGPPAAADATDEEVPSRALSRALSSSTALLAAPLNRHMSRVLTPPSHAPSLHGLCERLASCHRLITTCDAHAVRLAAFLGSPPTEADVSATDVSDVSDAPTPPPPRATTAPAEAASASPARPPPPAPVLVALHTGSAKAAAEFSRVRATVLAQISEASALPAVTASGHHLPPTLGSAVSDGSMALETVLDAHEHAISVADACGDGGDGGDGGDVGDVGAAAGVRAQALITEIVSALLARCKASAAPPRGASGGADLGGVLAARQAAGTSDPDRLVPLLNAIESMRAILAARVPYVGRTSAESVSPPPAPPPHAAARAVDTSLTLLTGELNNLIDEIAREAAAGVLRACGLDAKLSALQTADAQSSIAMADIVGLEPLALSSTMRAFYGVLFRRADEILPTAHLIASPDVRAQATSQTARTLASTHAHIHALVLRPGAGYSAPETILLHTPREVEALLGL